MADKDTMGGAAEHWKKRHLTKKKNFLKSRNLPHGETDKEKVMNV